ncbi:hypothetical protein AB0B25_21395 [Nocardia sp. NPDC049190]|uniref:hypothetical protein n=1 Tax=Nocardia sp. NPDC049190 TaxID=3155650 RepID=UPI00340E2742
MTSAIVRPGEQPTHSESWPVTEDRTPDSHRLRSVCEADDLGWNDTPIHDVGTWQQDLCHIRVRFTCPSLELDYQDYREVADRFAAVAHKVGADVTIDDELCDSRPPLPCRRLWT